MGYTFILAVCLPQEKAVMQMSEEVDGTTDKPLKIPKEMWLLVDHLYRNACRQVCGESGS